MDAIDSAIVLLNSWGRASCDFVGSMFLQSSILVGLLLIADLCLRARVSARFRYAMWLLVLVKLVLPPSLALPTGVNYWLGRYLPTVSAMGEPAARDVLATPLGWVELPVGSHTMSAISTKAAENPRPSLEWAGLALFIWSVGALLLLALVVRRILSARRSLARSHPGDSERTALLEECRADLGITVPVTLRLTDDAHPPAVCGFLHPVILLPKAMPPGLGQEALRTIFAHELTHIKRCDPWVNLAQAVLQVIYFWHPLVWAANARLRHLRELAVDETVVATLRSQALCYTDTLIDIAEMAFRKPAFSLRLIGIAESKRALERRITHMLNPHTFNRGTPGWSGLVVILALGAILVPMGQASPAAQAQPQAVQSAPALPAGIAELFQLDKDAVLKKFGKPNHLFYGDQTYTLDNLPDEYFMSYDAVSFCIADGAVVGITLLSPSYVFGNSIRVGDSEEKVKQAFGPPSGVKETQFKDFLNYESVGLSFEIHRQKRSVMEINIDPDYGSPARLQAYARAGEFAASLPPKLAQFDIDKADLRKVVATFGEPVKYIWGPKTLPADQLPNRFIAVYPGSFNVFMLNDRVVEVRHEYGSKYVFAGKLRVGSTLEEAIAVLGTPAKTVQGEGIDWQNSANVLFRDIDSRKGHDYYHRPDKKVRVWFGDDKVAAIYMTRSDYGQDRSTPADPEFARLLPERVARLDIDSASPEQVRKIFGQPATYVWGDKTFQADSLPNNYIMDYPPAFSVWIRDGRIMEIRHERGSPYAYRGKLRIGSTLQEALDVLGQPDETVTGQKNAFKDKVLYKDIDGEKGHDYYHRADQKVRVWFGDDRVIAIYVTHSDFPAGR
ncbi:MAG: M56 family metallopeptidase [Phycisphaerae bacterium]|nr:M56 family metallopeptidase [Phycisphaerae bacterium]